MKKNILRKDFIIEIKKTMGRFVSIFFIVALGVAFYSGIRASEPSMRITADQYFDDSELMDLKVMGTMGLTKADIKAIGKVSGIEAVEGGYSKDVLCPVGDNEKVVHMLSMQKNFNQVSVVKGRLPEKAGECLVDEDFSELYRPEGWRHGNFPFWRWRGIDGFAGYRYIQDCRDREQSAVYFIWKRKQYDRNRRDQWICCSG